MVTVSPCRIGAWGLVINTGDGRKILPYAFFSLILELMADILGYTLNTWMIPTREYAAMCFAT